MTKTIAALQSEVAAAARVYYHGTASVYVDSIKAHGLIPREAKGADSWAKDHGATSLITEDRAVFLVRSEEQAKGFAKLVASIFPKARGALFRVTFPTDAKLVPDDKSDDESHYIGGKRALAGMAAVKYFGTIPPAWIRFVTLTDGSPYGRVGAVTYRAGVPISGRFV